MNHLITDAMLDDAAQALKGHRVRRGRCSCGATTPVERHMAEVVAGSVTPPIVAEVMDLLAEVRQLLVAPEDAS